MAEDAFDLAAGAAPVKGRVIHMSMTVEFDEVSHPEIPEVPAVPAIPEELDGEGVVIVAGVPEVPAIPAVPAWKEVVPKGLFKTFVPMSEGGPNWVQIDAIADMTATEKGQMKTMMGKRWVRAYKLGDQTEPVTTELREI